MTEKIKSLQDKISANKRTLSVLRFPENLGTEGTGNIFRLSINIPSGSKYLQNGKYRPAIDPETGKRTTPVFLGSNSTSVARRFDKNYTRTATTIDLYMPPQIQTNYASDWATEELGATGAVLEGAYGISEIDSWEGAKDAWEAVKNTVPQALLNAFAGTLQTLSPLNVQSARKLYQNLVVNPYIEVLFNGVSNRTFSFTFKMIPRNINEQMTIKKIVDELKFHRAPELKFQNQTNYWLFPSVFDIQFLNRTGENPWLFKISTCAMTNLTVDNSPDGNYASHKDGAPFSTQITMEFTELEQITKERAKQGF